MITMQGQGVCRRCRHPVVLKDAWARIEAHGRELRHMAAHGAAWTRTDCTHGLID